MNSSPAAHSSPIGHLSPTGRPNPAVRQSPAVRGSQCSAGRPACRIGQHPGGSCRRGRDSGVPAVLPEPVLPETLLAETALPKTVLPEAALPKTVLPEAALPKTVPPETVLAEAVPPETVLPETVLPAIGATGQASQPARASDQPMRPGAPRPDPLQSARRAELGGTRPTSPRPRDRGDRQAAGDPPASSAPPPPPITRSLPVPVLPARAAKLRLTKGRMHSWVSQPGFRSQRTRLQTSGLAFCTKTQASFRATEIARRPRDEPPPAAPPGARASRQGCVPAVGGDSHGARNAVLDRSGLRHPAAWPVRPQRSADPPAPPRWPCRSAAGRAILRTCSRHRQPGQATRARIAL